jgi:two-component system, OmpR family, response regulator CpxR
MRALLVEDNPLVRGALARELGSDYEVEAVASLAEATASLADGDLQLVICDHEIRGPGSGVAFLDEVAVSSPDAIRTLLVGAGTVATEPGPGVQLVLSKPVAPGDLLRVVHAFRAGGGAPEGQAELAAGRSRTVLVVDDSEDAQELVRAALTPAGFVTRSAYNGKDALHQLLDRQPPGLIVLDLMMPEMSGMELLGVLQSYRRLARVPVLIVSATAVPEPARLTDVEYLTKPFSNEVLVETVRRLIR